MGDSDGGVRRCVRVCARGGPRADPVDACADTACVNDSVLNPLLRTGLSTEMSPKRLFVWFFCSPVFFASFGVHVVVVMLWPQRSWWL